MGRVTVVGSANVDHVVRVTHLPQPGETVLGGAYAQHLGGKGANQAVAAARLGAHVSFMGAVGADAAGASALQALQAAGVDCSLVARLTDAATGIAVVTVDERGENQIAVAPGANLLLDAAEVSRHVAAAEPSVVLAVLEVPMDAVIGAAQAARDRGARILVNAAPGQPLPDALLATAPLIIVNAQELLAAGPSAAALLERGAEGVILTRGPDGAAVITVDGELSIAGEVPAVVVDSTGAGDAFCGALAAFLAEEIDLADAARMANVAAALSVRKPGARGGMVTRRELGAYLKQAPSA